jgi:hypothetical protein
MIGIQSALAMSIGQIRISVHHSFAYSMPIIFILRSPRGSLTVIRSPTFLR